MITFANAKINIGLQVVDRRDDGYHTLETVFFPVKVYDVLEVVTSDAFGFHPSGLPIPGPADANLCVKLYRQLQDKYNLPPIKLYLHKHIPIGAGLGGGSSDAAFMIELLSDFFNLNLPLDEKLAYASGLGADCAFFVRNVPAYATGIGNQLTDIHLDLSSFHIVLVDPGIAISTAQAYRSVKPRGHSLNLKEAIKEPVQEWKKLIVNDFEKALFDDYPVIRGVKADLYEEGAVYASMSGSGSVVYGLFSSKPELKALRKQFKLFDAQLI